jgi:hypothetical protein
MHCIEQNVAANLAEEFHRLSQMCTSPEMRDHYSEMAQHYSSLAEAKDLGILAYGE